MAEVAAVLFSHTQLPVPVRAKRAKSVEDGTWDCSVCTYKNSAEAFKCSMCDVRKGTSTRKPKPNPELVAQQVAQQLPPPLKRDKPPSVRRPERVEPSTETDTSQDSHRSDATDHSEHKKSRLTPSSESQRLRNIDRRSGVSMEVTVNGVTVVVTDYKPKSTAITSGSSSRSRMLTDINVGRDLASFPSVREQSNNVANSSSSSLTHSFTDDSHNDIVSD